MSVYEDIIDTVKQTLIDTNYNLTNSTAIEEMLRKEVANIGNDNIFELIGANIDIKLMRKEVVLHVIKEKVNTAISNSCTKLYNQN